MEENLTLPLVSVGIPTYNRPEGLRKTLDSIIKQTYNNLEIIVSDNCSNQKEEIETIIFEFQKRDSRIFFFRQDINKGAVYNFKFLLQKATGNFFMWASDDDYFESKNLIEELMCFAPHHTLSFSNFIWSNYSNTNYFKDSYSNCKTGLDYLFAWINNGSGQPIYGIYNLKLLIKEQLYFEFDADLQYYNEGTFLHRLFINGKVKFVPNVYIYYNENSKKPDHYILYLNFVEYACRTIKIYKKSNLTSINKKKALRIIRSKYSNYLYSLFVLLNKKEKKTVLYNSLKIPDIFLLVLIKYLYNKFLFYCINFIYFIKNIIKKCRIYIFYKRCLEKNKFKNDFFTFFNKENTTNKRFILDWKDRLPFMNEKTTAPFFDAHYVYHTAWAARIVKKNNPETHIDISSYVYFSTILSAFIPVLFFEYRPAKIKLSGLETKSADLCNLFFEDNSLNSVSCMHVIEHIGLGRYSDPLDYDGDLKAINELKRVLKPDGDLLFVVPVGKSKIMFNAHRIYSYDQIIDYFSDFRLIEFSLIPDNGMETGIIENAAKELVSAQNCGCGCFWFKK